MNALKTMNAWTKSSGYQSFSSAQNVLRQSLQQASACGSACGAGDSAQKEEQPSACGSACGAGDPAR